MSEDGPDAEEGVPPDDDEPPTAGDRAAPLADLAADVDQRREAAGDGLFERAFAEQPYDEDGDGDVWDAVEGDSTSEFGAIGEVIEEGEKTFIVSKRNFCERCRHFSEPPEVRCTHEGTEIREFVDMDNVRLYDCPIVEERGLNADGITD